jgi:hypothetical protein
MIVHWDKIKHGDLLRTSTLSDNNVVKLSCGQWLWSSHERRSSYKLTWRATTNSTVLRWLAVSVYEPGSLSLDIKEVTCMGCLVAHASVP